MSDCVSSRTEVPPPPPPDARMVVVSWGWVLLPLAAAVSAWRCPELSLRPAAECSCDMPRTLRCAGGHTAPQLIGAHLRAAPPDSRVSLLDLALRGTSSLTAGAVAQLGGLQLRGLVLTSGELRRLQQGAFAALADTLMALGLPNNELPSVPTESISNLPMLERLDLSYNKIHALEDDSFKGIRNLTYLDLSGNQLADMSSNAFSPLTELVVLRLRGNLLKVSSLGALKLAAKLRELDLSGNGLAGPLGPNTVPPLRGLVSLQLADNTFASIRRGSLAGLTNLTHLGLHNNQIDVLEDHAFRQLSNLTHLDLSHNEIVAVSGSSLAHLRNLLSLDLSHNFLRSLSAEPLRSLDKLSELLLHDNDISIIDDGALTTHITMRKFTIEDNPLNCDCLMSGFARWLREAKNLSQSDQMAAVCATPPHLEGALLTRLSKNKLCEDYDPEEGEKQKSETKESKNEKIVQSDDESVDAFKTKYLEANNTFDDDDAINYVEGPNVGDDYDERDIDDDLPTSKAKVVLEAAWLEQGAIHQTWSVRGGPPHAKYRCAGATLASAPGGLRHAACHKAAPEDVVLTGITVDLYAQYTLCIALEQLDERETAAALVLGCSEPTLLGSAGPERPTSAPVSPQRTAPSQPAFRVSEVRSNVTSDGVISVIVSLLGYPPPAPLGLHSRPQRLSSAEAKYYSNLHNCYIVIAILSRGSLVAQKDTPCQRYLEVTMDGFVRGPYEVCATLSKFRMDSSKSICVMAQMLESGLKAELKNVNVQLVGLSLGLVMMVSALVCLVRKLMRKPPELEPGCLSQEPPLEEARTNYVMLQQATSKV